MRLRHFNPAPLLAALLAGDGWGKKLRPCFPLYGPLKAKNMKEIDRLLEETEGPPLDEERGNK
jgi:hypothetical protein